MYKVHTARYELTEAFASGEPIFWVMLEGRYVTIFNERLDVQIIVTMRSRASLKYLKPNLDNETFRDPSNWTKGMLDDVATMFIDAWNGEGGWRLLSSVSPYLPEWILKLGAGTYFYGRGVDNPDEEQLIKVDNDDHTVSFLAADIESGNVKGQTKGLLFTVDREDDEGDEK